jgi:hypothetical protein
VAGGLKALEPGLQKSRSNAVSDLSRAEFRSERLADEQEQQTIHPSGCVGLPRERFIVRLYDTWLKSLPHRILRSVICGPRYVPDLRL